jgi:hypothetical protein
MARAAGGTGSPARAAPAHSQVKVAREAIARHQRRRDEAPATSARRELVAAFVIEAASMG